MDAARAEAHRPEVREAPDLRDLREVVAAREALDALEVGGAHDARIDVLHAEAKAAIGSAANVLRSVRERYREAYTDELGRWQAASDALDLLERRPFDAPPSPATGDVGGGRDAAAADAADELGRLRARRAEVGQLGQELGGHQTELAKLEIALRNLESTWLFLERGDASLVTDPGGDNLAIDVQMRIVQAQESERSRLAQEVHDGPAQALSNTIFKVEYIERLMEHDEGQARTELQVLSELLRRELGSVRAFIGQLRPPVLDELGLGGAIADAVGRQTAMTGLTITVQLEAPSGRLAEAQQTVVLRIVQEALQNVRKHGGASSVIVASVVDGGDWVLTVRDDGRGFDVGAVAARGRRNFGLQFMQERAELIGASLEVHSQPGGGTLVRLAIPVGVEEIG